MESETKKCFILNKTFQGAWNEEKGNISHEIINFFKTDSGELYAFNEPYGSLPSDIYCENDKNKKGYLAEYLFLTSKTKDKKFYIQYRIKLKERLHSLKYVRDKSDSRWEKSKNQILNIIENKKIIYGNKKLSTIFENNFDCLLVTFLADKIEVAESPIYIDDLVYNFQRNKGYIRSDKYEIDGMTDYERIEKKLKNVEWKDYNPPTIGNDEKFKVVSEEKTFLDLIMKVDSEECYTNILYSILSYNDLIKKFLEEFGNDKEISSNVFKVKRETGIVDGRMDICAETDNQRVVIENKIHSGLNGFEIVSENEQKKDSEVISENNTSITQLGKYYKWANEICEKNEINLNPLCFVVCPDYRKNEIEAEIKQKESEMVKENYTIIGYSQIVKFIENSKNYLDENYEYYKYRDDLAVIFDRHAQKSEKAKIESEFLTAIRLCK